MATKKSGARRDAKSSSDSPFSEMSIAGSGRVLSGEGNVAVERASAPASAPTTGGITSAIACTRARA